MSDFMHSRMTEELDKRFTGEPAGGKSSLGRGKRATRQPKVFEVDSEPSTRSRQGT